MIERIARNPFALAGVVVLAMLLGAATYWSLQRAASLAGSERARIETVVHDYVLDHPEIIPEAMQMLQERETGKVVAANRAAIVEPFAGAWAGNPRGDVTVVEYFDYNCVFCRASLATVAALIASDPQVRVVYREFPILNQESVDAARMSLAAAVQGKFRQYHDALYAAGPVTPQTIAAAARSARIDLAAAAGMTRRAEEEIARNRKIAQLLGITGTPGWVIGNRVVSAALPLEAMQRAVAAARVAR